MAKKLKAVEEANDTQLADAVRNSAQQIWQAGLGALVKAQKEGGDAFAKLVKDGADAQQRTQQLAEEKFSGVAQTVARLADNFGKQAVGSWERLGSVFEDRVSRSLHSLGIPTQNDIQALTMQIEALNESVNMLLGREATAKAAAEKPAARRPVAKAARKARIETSGLSAAVKGGARASTKRGRTGSVRSAASTSSPDDVKASA